VRELDIKLKAADKTAFKSAIIEFFDMVMVVQASHRRNL
jgi:hypothetical protein